jgi:hypothetical protein
MQEEIAVKEQVKGSGTITRERLLPDSIFATALYRDTTGREIALPLEVVGEHITLQVERPQPQK